jgi:hypothetical protein
VYPRFPKLANKRCYRYLFVEGRSEGRGPRPKDLLGWYRTNCSCADQPGASYILCKTIRNESSILVNGIGDPLPFPGKTQKRGEERRTLFTCVCSLYNPGKDGKTSPAGTTKIYNLPELLVQ